MENDYISRVDVKKLLWERISLATFMRRGVPNAMKSLSLITEELEKIPAADVRPVVYCKDCTLSRENGFFCTSTFHGGMTFPNDFCSYGERREGGADG